VRVAASESERRQLNETFAALCAAESPSGQERVCADLVVAQLAKAGVEVVEDDAAAVVGGDCGNLFARVPAREQIDAPSVLLCAHLDTVPPAVPVRPVVRDGAWQNDQPGVLGADNKAAVAVVLQVARRAAEHGLSVGLELLFTVGEERALAGARALEPEAVRSRIGFVFDHATPIGDVVVASPSLYRLEASFHGAAAHSGIRPEQGRSAIVAAARAVADMRLGRLDEQTTANVGTIGGGSAINVVPERCTLLAEVRSLSEARAEEVVAEMVDRIHDAANMPDCDCDVDVSVQRLFAGYRLGSAARPVAAASRALRRCGHEPRLIESGGASDANELQRRGLQVVNLADGSERNHEPGERIGVVALEGLLDVALTLTDELAPRPANQEDPP